MKNIRKIGLFMITVLSIMAFTACSKAENKSVVYELDVPGTKSVLTIEYNDKNIVKKSISENTLTYEELGREKEIVDEEVKAKAKTYEGMKGAEHKIDYTDEGITEKLVINYDDISKDVKNVLFGSISEEDGTILLDKYVEQFKSFGYTKKEK